MIARLPVLRLFAASTLALLPIVFALPATAQEPAAPDAKPTVTTTGPAIPGTATSASPETVEKEDAKTVPTAIPNATPVSTNPVDLLRGGPPTPLPVGTATTSAAEETVAQPRNKGLGGAMRFLIVLAVFVVPIVLANVLSKALRMQDYVWRFFFVLFAISASLAAVYLGGTPKLGVDLQGGVNLVYEMAPTKSDDAQSGGDLMDKLVGTISRRINPGGIKEVTVRPFGNRNVEIVVPGADQDELDRLKDIISRSGALEFRILANHHKYQNKADAALAQQRREEAAGQPLSNVVIGELEGGKGKGVIARWIPVEASKTEQFMGPKFITRQVPGDDGRVELQVLCILDQYNVTGDYLVNASPGLDNGENCVVFSFNGEGANRFSLLTGENIPDAAGQGNDLGIVLDGYLQSAPRINSIISDRGQITGNFTEKEVKALSEILTAGALPAALNRTPVSEELTGPSLGEDTIRSGVTSMLVATAAVVVFMLVYYRFAGIVANIAVILNTLLTVAFMMMFNAAFTLAGLADLALTVGMAVDANVLIYERIREELARGATLRMAIRNGFDRATVTIIDANLTTLITAVVLYIIGTDQIKGFAVTLTVGLVMNLFTAITVSRLLFDMAERNRWITNLKFMQLLGRTNYDFIGKRYICYALSIGLIGIGMVATVIRGKELLNIDFTGGVSITTVFDKSHEGGIADVREQIEKVLPQATVQELKVKDTPEHSVFKIVTSDPDRADVEAKIKTLFNKELAVYHLTAGAATPIPGTAPAGETPAAPGNATPGNAEPKPKDQSSLVEPNDSLALAESDDADSSCEQEPAADDTDKKTDEKKADEKKKAAKKKKNADADKQPARAEKEASPPKSSSIPATPVATPTTTPSAPAASSTSPAATPPAAMSTGTAASPPTSNPLSGGTLGSGGPAFPALDASALPGSLTAPAANPFAGGTQVMLTFHPPINHQRLEEELKKIVQQNPDLPGTRFELTAPEHKPKSSKPLETWTLKIASPPAETDATLAKLTQQFTEEPFFPSSANIGGTVADSAKQAATVAMIISLTLVMAYVWFRFQNVAFGFAAILALVHDVLFTIGCLALSYWGANYLGFALVEPFKIDLTIVAALLTIIGYSINDTIVIFDRIREVRGKSPTISGDLINLCVNQTLSRTILTSLTVFIVVLILYIWGGAGIHGFAFALVVGTISGTYSTIYVASPVLLWLQKPTTSPSYGKNAASTT